MLLKDILVFRHGETDWNLQKRLQGHSDIPLNDRGRNQAKILEKGLLPYQPEVIVSSDLSRAFETAQIANRSLQCQIHVTPALRECHMGLAEGIFRDSLLEKFGQESWDRWLSANLEDQHFSFPEGESKAQHLRRLLAHIEDFLKTNIQYQRIAVSTHGGSLYRLIQNCRNAPKSNLVVPNCALFHFHFNIESREWTYVEQVQIVESALTQPVS